MIAHALLYLSAWAGIFPGLSPHAEFRLQAESNSIAKQPSAEQLAKSDVGAVVFLYDPDTGHAIPGATIQNLDDDDLSVQADADNYIEVPSAWFDQHGDLWIDLQAKGYEDISYHLLLHGSTRGYPIRFPLSRPATLELHLSWEGEPLVGAEVAYSRGPCLTVPYDSDWATMSITTYSEVFVSDENGRVDLPEFSSRRSLRLRVRKNDSSTTSWIKEFVFSPGERRELNWDLAPVVAVRGILKDEQGSLLREKLLWAVATSSRDLGKSPGARRLFSFRRDWFRLLAKTTTGLEGEFEFEALPREQIWIGVASSPGQAIPSGYPVLASEAVLVDLQSSEGVLPLDLLAHTYAEIRGVVVDQKKRTLARASLRAWYEHDPLEVFHLTTDEEGRFHLQGLLAEPITIQATHWEIPFPVQSVIPQDPHEQSVFRIKRPWFGAPVNRARIERVPGFSNLPLSVETANWKRSVMAWVSFPDMAESDYVDLPKQGSAWVRFETAGGELVAHKLIHSSDFNWAIRKRKFDFGPSAPVLIVDLIPDRISWVNFLKEGALVGSANLVLARQTLLYLPIGELEMQIIDEAGQVVSTQKYLHSGPWPKPLVLD
jgi:hypothetical protein